MIYKSCLSEVLYSGRIEYLNSSGYYGNLNGPREYDVDNDEEIIYGYYSFKPEYKLIPIVSKKDIKFFLYSLKLIYKEK